MARCVQSAIEARFPRLRYTVGKVDQRLAAHLKDFLPGGLFERILKGHYGG